MCKLVYVKVSDGTAYQRAIEMIRFQEHRVAGHSTGLTFRSPSGFSTRKAIGKVNSFLAKYPDIPSSDEVLGHSRYATVGAITLENAQPISIMFGEKKIGYGVHNGTWTDYQAYESYRSQSMVNKTDSALLFTIYSRVLEQMGDSPMNRRRAFASIMSLIRNEGNRNLILMFKDGMTIFGGNYLTFHDSEEKVGIMSFGLPHHVVDDMVYVVGRFGILKYQTLGIQRMTIRRDAK